MNRELFGIVAAILTDRLAATSSTAARTDAPSPT